MNSLTLKFCKAKSQLAWLCWLVIGMTVTPAAWSAPTVPAGFTIREVVTGLPNTLQDVAPGQGGAFGTDLYYISFPNQIMRVNPSGGTPTLFSTVNGTPSPKLTVLSFGFGGDLYAVDGNYQPGKVYRIQSDGTSSLFSNGVSTSSEGIAYSPGGDFGNNLYLSEFDNNPNPISSINSSGTVKLFTTLPNDSYRLTGLAFANGGGFGTSLYGVNQIGTIYKVASYGTNIAFPVNPPFR